ncbi:peptidoglycan editing factor PgeF [Fusobacterium sp.]|uniref:peptidoglycan editing factor PgeF n=1 Tax=Fusobacterium sp. TaxID=68766 RepID=UPI0026203632|nr:peptidoglycan editing factor PgeF [Fusobacterium sp.]
MFVDKEKYFEIDDFKKFGVEALYTTKDIGNIDTLFKDEEKSGENIYKCFGKKDSIVIYAKQTHTNKVIDIDEKTDKYFYEEVDGFISKRKDVVLMTQYADCLPIFLYDKVNHVIGVCHSGWKGSFQEIGIKTIELMEEKYSSSRENILVALGIGISCEKYEVGVEFYENFKNNFSKEIVENSFKFFEDDNKWHFDNTEFNRLNLIKNGILSENIIVSKECTYKNNRFHSFRRDKNSMRNAGMIFFK